HSAVERPVLYHDGTCACCGQVTDLEADHKGRGSFRIQPGDLFNEVPIKGLDHVGVVGVELVQFLGDAASEIGPFVAMRLELQEQADTSGVGFMDEVRERGD